MSLPHSSISFCFKGSRLHRWPAAGLLRLICRCPANGSSGCTHDLHTSSSWNTVLAQLKLGSKVGSKRIQGIRAPGRTRNVGELDGAGVDGLHQRLAVLRRLVQVLGLRLHDLLLQHLHHLRGRENQETLEQMVDKRVLQL